MALKLFRAKYTLFNEKLIRRLSNMITFCIIVLILAIAGVIFGVCGLGFAVIFGDVVIGIVLLVLIIKKIFFDKKNKDK